MPAPVDSHAVLQRLYGDTHGYTADPVGEARVEATGSSPTYGELMPAATDRLVARLRLGPDDTFYDLGSGIGKVVIQIAMTVPVARCVGIELMPSRHRIARRVLARVRAEDRLRASACHLRCSDFMRARVGDATVVYTCSTAFSTALMNALAARLARSSLPLRWVSTQDVDDNPWFELEDVLRLDMSWRRRSKVYVYRLIQPNRSR